MPLVSNTKAHVSIVLDGVEAQRVLNALRNQAALVREEMAKMEQDGKVDTKAYKELQRTLKSLEGDYAKNTKQLSDLNEVMSNLSSQTTRQLDAALRTISKVMKDVDTSTEEGRKKMAELTKQEEAVAERNRILKAGFVDVADVIANVGTESTKHIQQAIRQLEFENTQVAKNTAEYKQNYQQIVQLNKELDKRDGKMTGQRAGGLASGTIVGSTNEIKEALRYFQELRDNMKQDNAKGLDFVDQRIASLNEKLRQTSASTIDVRTVMQHLGDVSNATLTRAVEQQKKYVDSLDQSDPAYKQELANLNRLNTALELRNGKMNAVAANQVYQNVSGASADELKQAIDYYEKLKSTIASTNTRGIDAITARLNVLREQQQQNILSTERFNAIIGNVNGASLDDLKGAIKVLETRIAGTTRGTEEYFALCDQYKDVQGAIEDINDDMKEQDSLWDTIRKKVGGYAATLTAAFAGGKLVETVFGNTLEYSDALADIQKTTGITGKSLDELAAKLKQIDTRTAVADINALAYSAGKLGVTGVQDVEAFVRSANMLTVALGDELGGAQATEELMKIANLMGSISTDGLEGALLRTGSAINEVTQASTASAAPIVDFMSRVASVGQITGMSTADLVGLGSAINALGQNTEAAASSVQKMLVSIATNTDGVAKALKMSAQETEQFFADVANGRMTQAFLTVLEKTKDTDGLKGLKEVVGDIGGDGVRTIQTLSVLSSSVDQVSSLIRLSNDAYAEGSSVVNEYNIKNENAAALWERLKNNFAKLTFRPEFVKALEDTLRRLQHLPDAVGRFVDSLSPLGTALMLLVDVFIKLTPLVTGFLYALTVRTVIVFGAQVIALGKGLFTAAGAFVRAASGANSFGAALRMVGKATMLNMFTALATIVFSIAEAFISAAREAREFAGQVAESFQAARKQADESSRAIESSIKALREANTATGERATLIRQLNEQYGDYLGNLLDEKMDNDQIEASLRAVNAQLRMKAMLQAKAAGEEQIRTSFGSQRGEAMGNLQNTIAEWLQTSGVTADAAITRAQSLAETLIGEASTLLREVKDAMGNVTGYTTASGSRREDREDNAKFQQQMRQLFGADSGAANMGFTMIQKALADYMNVDAKMQTRINQSNSTYDRDIQKEAAAEQADVEPLMNLAWQKIEDIITQQGTITARITEQQGAQYLAYAQGLAKDVQASTMKDVTAYVTYATRMLEDMRHQGADKDAKGNLTPEYEALLTRLQNAISMQSSLRTASANANTTNPTTEPTDNENNEALRAARDRYKAGIEAVDSYYQMQRQAVNDSYERQEIDIVERESRLREIEQRNLQSRVKARQRVIGAITEQQWKDEQQLMQNLNRAGDEGLRQLGRIAETDMKAMGDLLKKLGKDSEFETVIKQIQDDVVKAQTLRIKRIEQLEQMVIGQSALAKLTAEYQETLQQLDLISSKFMAEGETDLKAYFQRMMAIAREVGKQAGSVDISTSDGVSQARETMVGAGMSSDQVYGNADKGIQGMSNAEVQAYWLQSYKYSEAYAQMSQKLARQTLDAWEKTYASEGEGRAYDRRIEQYRQMAKIAERMEQYGLSEAVALEKQLDIASALYVKEKARLDAKMQKARDDRQLAEGITDDNVRTSEIAKADEEIALVEQEYEKLIPLYEGMMDAAISLEEFNHRWVLSMKDSFVELFDNLVAFRSFYDDNGSPLANIFGTKEDRQEAFGNFVDSLKKATRAAIMEKVKQSLSMKLQDNIDLAWRKMFLNKEAAQEQMAQSKRIAQKAAGHATEQAIQTTSDTIIETQNATHNAKLEAQDTEHTVKDTALSEASGVAKAFAELGPIAGAVAVALITAVIGTFLTMALNTVGKGKSNNTPTGTTTRLTSGMLTYDEGNAHQVLKAPLSSPQRGMTGATPSHLHTSTPSPLTSVTDGNRRYAAVTDYAASGLVTRPTITTVQGQPALVAENGPELVVGRETTRALMMDHPNIVRTIMALEARRRHQSARRAWAYDEGNAADVLNIPASSQGEADLTPSQGATAITAEQLQANTAVMQALLEQLQHPIRAEFNMNGKGGAADQIAQGLLASKKLGDLDSVRRLLGK